MRLFTYKRQKAKGEVVKMIENFWLGFIIGAATMAITSIIGFYLIVWIRGSL